MKDVKEKFRNINIWSFDGKGDINNILKFQSIFNITLPNTYRELMTRYNNPKFEQDTLCSESRGRSGHGGSKCG